MPDYGYLHRGEIVSYDALTGSYFLKSVSLARTQRWGPVASCVPGLVKGDRVVLGATGTSRDDLVILGKIGDDLPDISDVQGLLDALADKASAVELQSVAEQLDALSADTDTRYEELATRLDVAETSLTTLTDGLADANAELDALTATVAANRLVRGGAWFVNEEYQCPGTTLANCDRMPLAGELWHYGTDVVLGPDKKHLIVNTTGIWRVNSQPRYTAPIRIPSGTAGEGTDRSFHIGVTGLDIGPDNATFETGVTGWTTVTCALASSGTQKHSGTLSARVTPTGTDGQAAIVGSKINALPGQKWTVAMWVWCTNATANFSASINWYDASSTYLTTSAATVSVPAATWTPVIATFTAPASTAKGAPIAQMLGTPAVGQVFYVDDVSIYPGISATDMFLFEESWHEVNSGNQHNQTVKLGSELLLAAGNKVMLFCFWGGTPLTDRLVFPAVSNRLSLTYAGPVS